MYETFSGTSIMMGKRGQLCLKEAKTPDFNAESSYLVENR